jgi:GNAT superfamily N-acetyltransferase
MSSDHNPRVRAATADRWEDVAAVMKGRGDPARCWCQFFRLRGQDWRSASPAANRTRLRRQVQDADHAPGVLAYIDEQPVGWCAVAPRACYPRVVASKIAGVEQDGVWSVTCFVVRVGWRRRGVATALLEGAVELARSAGAAVVEAYPVDPDARSTVSSAELYHGPLSVFLDAGFREVRRSSPARALVQLKL